MGTLFVVATPIGNLNDFSKRAEETLRQSNLILVEDTRQTIKLLNHFDIKVKMLSYHKFNERERVSEIINLLNEGNDISLVSDAGTPCISDPGYILIKEALENDIKVIGIRHGEKMYETLLTDEECVHAIDMGNFYRVPADKRDLNYDKYFSEGMETSKLTQFNSNNTELMDVEAVKNKLLEVKLVREELEGWDK